MNNSKTAPGYKATSQMRERHKDTNFLRHLMFTQQEKAGWYALDAEYAEQLAEHFSGIPATIQIQQTFKKGIQSTWVMTSIHDEGFFRIFTGIRPAGVQDWYYGDIPGFYRGGYRKRLLLVEFSPDRYQFRLYLFNGYPSEKTRRSDIKRTIRTVVGGRVAFTHKPAPDKPMNGVDSNANRLPDPSTIQGQQTIKTPLK